METLLNILIIFGACVLALLLGCLILFGLLHLLFTPVYVAEKAAGPGAKAPKEPPPPEPHPTDHARPRPNLPPQH